jgi:hypothetical protein
VVFVDMNHCSEKLNLWEGFTDSHCIADKSVPLFDVSNGQVAVIPYGRDKRRVLKRSVQMEALMREFGRTLIGEYENGSVEQFQFPIS